jgi:copper(I)-binding protein
MKRVILALAVAISTLGPITALAGPNSIAVEHAWARATPKSASTGAAFVTLVNNGTSDDRLLGVTSPAAERTQLFSESIDNGVMKMTQLLSLDLHPGTPVVFKPGGIHMMLMGLKQPLSEGQTFPLTLTFEKAGVIEATVAVGKIGAIDDTAAHAKAGG